MNLDPYLLRYAHMEALTHDFFWGHGWMLFPGVPILAFAMLFAYTVEHIFSSIPQAMRRLMAFTMLFGVAFVASAGMFSVISVKGVELADREKPEEVAFIDSHFCVVHLENNFCRAKRYLKL